MFKGDLLGKTVAVVGLGVYGSAVANELTGHGAQVIGIDQYHPPHTMGSSHGGTRMTRFANFEGQENVTTAIRTAQIYAALQSHPHIRSYLERKYGAGELYVPNGTLIVGPARIMNTVAHGTQNPIWQTVTMAQLGFVGYELMRGVDVRARFPTFHIPDDRLADTMGYFEPESGTLFPERCVDAQLEMARMQGAHFRFGTKVQQINDNGPRKRLETTTGPVDADAVVVCAGPWVQHFMPGMLKSYFRTTRQVSAWFKTDDEAFSIGSHPNFVRFFESGQGYDVFYGFPRGAHDAKFAQEWNEPVDVDDAERLQVRPGELQRLFNAVSPYMNVRGLRMEGGQAKACLYTETPDHQFVVDRIPGMENAYVFSACSGHGFKHAAALAESFARAMTGSSGLIVINSPAYRWKPGQAAPA